MNQDETIRMSGGEFEAEVLTELRRLNTRISSLEEKIQAANWEVLRADFSKHHREVMEVISDVNRKFDVVSRELLQVKADQVKTETRLTQIESEVRPNVIPQDRSF